MANVKLNAQVNGYIKGMQEAENKTPRATLSTPLRNSIRSLWTPEKSHNPQYLRLIRTDKVVIVTIGIASLVTTVGLIVCGIALIHLTTGYL